MDDWRRLSGLRFVLGWGGKVMVDDGDGKAFARD